MTARVKVNTLQVQQNMMHPFRSSTGRFRKHGLDSLIRAGRKTKTATPIVVYGGKNMSCAVIYPKNHSTDGYKRGRRKKKMAQHANEGMIHGCYLCFRSLESMIKIETFGVMIHRLNLSFVQTNVCAGTV